VLLLVEIGVLANRHHVGSKEEEGNERNEKNGERD